METKVLFYTFRKIYNTIKPKSHPVVGNTGATYRLTLTPKKRGEYNLVQLVNAAIEMREELRLRREELQIEPEDHLQQFDYMERQ